MHGYAELNTDYKGRELFLHTIGTCHFFRLGGGGGKGRRGISHY